MSTARVDALLAEGARQLPGAEARFEAELLLGHALGRDRAWLFAHARDAVDAAAAARFVSLCARRARGEPVAYIIGRRGFWTLDLAVTPDTLVPRPETELLVEAALARLPLDPRSLKRPLQIADLGTGSGAIALSLASERPLATVLATDASAAALAVAGANARDNAIDNVRFVQGDWLQPLAGLRFDLIASNPPYVAEGDPHLGEGDLRFEPAMALSSGSDGLDALRTIISGAPLHLEPGGVLLVEHGLEQGPSVRALFSSAGFLGVETLRDLEQRERITLGAMPS